MSGLLKAELLRLVSRRLLVVLLVCMVALAAFGAALDAGSASPLSAKDHQEARSTLQTLEADWQEACGSPGQEGQCQGWDKPTGVEELLRTPAGFGEYAEGVVSLGFPLALLAVAILAASLIGAEFSSGNIGTQLLFTPRRLPVMVAKVAAGVVGGMLLAAAYLGTATAFCALMFLSLRGAHDMTAGVDLPLALGRMAVLSLLVAVMSGSIAMGVGSTLITLGVFAVVGLGSAMLSTSLPPHLPVLPYLPDVNLTAMIQGQAEFHDWSSYELGPVQVVHYEWALGYSVIGTVLIVLVSGWWFWRRDILR